MSTVTAQMPYAIEAKQDEKLTVNASSGVGVDASPIKPERCISPRIAAIVKRDIKEHREIWVALAS